MADKRRRRTTAVNSLCDDNKDFHAVTILGSQPRRRSASHGQSRADSWMAKVTTAMSQRIFSKKLHASRSTQVMPVDTSGQATSSVSGSLAKGSPALRQASSETSLACTPPALNPSESISTVAAESTTTEVCPFVICDVAPDDDDVQESSRKHSRVSADRSSRRQQLHSAADKVTPQRRESEPRVIKEAQFTRHSTANSMLTSRYQVDEDLDALPSVAVQDTSPILKDFFSRNATSGQVIRAQQRDQQRKSLYKDSKERHDKLREQADQERLDKEAGLRKLKVDQLRRLNLQRRLAMRQEAASARKVMLSRVRTDEEAYLHQREQWENEFLDEIRLLSSAFRKAHARDYQLENFDRPMTVAGLAVPEALSQIRREASGYEKRVKTADASAKMALRPGSEDLLRRPRSQADKSVGNILRLEDSVEMIYEMDGDAEWLESEVEPIEGQPKVQDLLQERELLLRRIAELEAREQQSKRR